MITWVNDNTSDESPDYPNGTIRIRFVVHNAENTYIYYVRS